MKPESIVSPGEVVIHVFRRHSMSVLPIIAALSLLPLIAFAASMGLALYAERFQLSASFAISNIGLLALAVLAFLLIYGVWIVHRGNIVIVSDKNLYAVTRHGLFSKTVVQVGLRLIQDVSAKQHGVVATICNYGDLRVETAGDTPNFLFKTCSNPDGVAQQLMAAHQKAIATPSLN